MAAVVLLLLLLSAAAQGWTNAECENYASGWVACDTVWRHRERERRF